jgi:N-acyl-D-aspartate/D-glutamate deacylase
MYDLLLKGGRVYDGSGLPAFNADVAIAEGRIQAIGRVNEPAKRTLHLDGLAVSPGFIDFHTHLDAQFFWDPLGSSLNEHGVTTVITGNCGLTLAPAKPEDHEALVGTFIRVEGMPAKVLRSQVPWGWTTHGGYMEALRQRPLGLNIATLIGHCAVRHYVMGDDSVERPATEDEIRQMEALVRDGMDAGAFGFSTNMNDRHFREDGKPIPSRLAEREEVDRLCAVVGECQRGVVQFSHGGFRSAEHMDWYNDVAKATGRPLVWQSILHRWADPDMWRRQLEQAADSHRQGAPAYPLTNARPFSNRWTMKNAQVFDELPTWKNLLFLPLEARKQAFRDPEVRRKMTFEAVEDTRPISFSRRWDIVRIRKTVLPHNKRWENRSVAEYAEAWQAGRRGLPRSVPRGGSRDAVREQRQSGRSRGRRRDPTQPLRAGGAIRRRRTPGLRRRLRLRYTAAGLLDARAQGHAAGGSGAQADVHGGVYFRHPRSRPVAARPRGGRRRVGSRHGHGE